jgi:hypothetical protein
MAFLSRRRVLQGDGAVHAYRVCDWQPGKIPQRDAQAHAGNWFFTQLSGSRGIVMPQVLQLQPYFFR